MIDLLAAEGITVAAWYRCPHGPDVACACRKPAPGLIHAAVRDLDLDPARSFVIGDKWSDIELAAAVGAVGILVTTGYGIVDADRVRKQRVAVCRDLVEADGEITRYLALDRV